MFKTIKEQDVKDVLITLITENGTTTALDVKKALRKNGFWATQSNVSQLLSETFRHVNVTRTNNGSYFIYELEQDLDEIDDLDEDEVDDQDQDSDDQPIVNKSVGRGVIVSEPTMLSADIYELIINHNGDVNYLVISNEKNLLNVGTLVYEVRSGNDMWYLYSDDPTIITRHKAIYYVWKVVSQEYDGFLAYADLRSKKMF